MEIFVLFSVVWCYEESHGKVIIREKYFCNRILYFTHYLFYTKESQSLYS